MSDITNLEMFEENILVQDAVERRLTIIGEATHRLRKLGISLQHSDSMVNRRNTIIHQYDDFSVRSVWRTTQEDLPLMLQEVQDLLAQPDFVN